MNRIGLIFLLLLVTNMVSAVDKQQPPKVGNFALPGSQQPGQFLSFGANIVDKDQSQFSVMATHYQGASMHQATLAPGYLYGLTDQSSILVQLPMAVNYKAGTQHSSGVADALLQFESAFYNEQTSCYIDQATIVSGLFIPTGDLNKTPATGVGSMSLLVGGTLTRTYIDWLYFTALGAQLSTTENAIKPGNQFLYQFGLGKNIFNIGSEWILAWVVEFDGQYTQRNKVQNQKDFNTGGNVVTLTPSFFISCKSFAFQTGIGIPVIQALHGEQSKNHYVFAAQFVFSHYP